MNITIIGAGNIGLQFAVHCKEKGNNVQIYTSKIIPSDLTIVNEDGQVIHEAKGIKGSNDIEECVSTADLIFITYPAFMTEQIESKLQRFPRLIKNHPLDTV